MAGLINPATPSAMQQLTTAATPDASRNGVASWTAPTVAGNAGSATINNPFTSGMTDQQLQNAAGSYWNAQTQGAPGATGNGVGANSPTEILQSMSGAGIPYSQAMRVFGNWQDPNYSPLNSSNEGTAQGASNRFQTGADYVNQTYGPGVRDTGSTSGANGSPGTSVAATTGAASMTNLNSNTFPGGSGLSGSTVGTPNTLSSPFTPANPSQINLNSPQMTIAGNIGNYLDPNSDVNQMIKTKALEAANQGGTLNSSMTDSAVSNGIIANAQQMAQNDQNTYANASGQNASLSTNAAINNMQGLNQLGIAQLGQQTQLQLQNLQNQNKTLLQSSSVAQQVYNTALQQIGTIQGNSAYDAATKNTLINQIMQATQAQLQDQSSITGLNVGQYFGNYSSTPTA